ncbi:unnamed protein product [Rhizophagus irregularis]|uniref:PPM-type phosphatase domain-containing protein n=1 Tax=Rhizophagus irregularis TaxID=588596 RepID=A0A915Z8I5_9GLOM|nr:unnamed protein product [Rhizophagus irregularis]CAB5365486.1 unnamed protein product [Rhizophagus irregularis]
MPYYAMDNVWKDESSKFVPDENDLSKYNDGSTAVVTVITPNKIVYVGNLGNSRAVMSNFDRESQRIIIQAGRNPGNYNNNPDKGPKEQIFIAYPDMIMFRKVDTYTDFLVLARDGIWDRMSFEDVINFINKDIKIDKAPSKACEN